MRQRPARIEVEAALLAAILLPLISWGVRVMGVRRCRALLGATCRRPDPRIPRRRALARGRRVARAVDLANDRLSPVVAGCVPRALTLWWLCRRLRLRATFRLGVRTLTGRFEAHAWVEVSGEPVGELERVEAIYTTFDPERDGGAS